MAGEDQFPHFSGGGTSFAEEVDAAVVANAPASATGDALEVKVGGVHEGGFLVNGEVDTSAPTKTTAPTAGTASSLPAAPAGYVELDVAGTNRWVAYYA